MKLPSVPAGVRMLAYVVAISAVPLSLFFMGMNLRSTAEMRRQLLEIEADNKLHTVRLESAVQDLSVRIGNASARMQHEMAFARHDDQKVVARLGSRFARSLSAVQGKLDDLASQLRNNAPSLAKAAASTSGAAASSAPVAIPASATAAPAEQDLRVLQKLREGSSFFESAEYSRAQKSYAAVLALQPDNMDARFSTPQVCIGPTLQMRPPIVSSKSISDRFCKTTQRIRSRWKSSQW